jgi:hypothetical protein
MPPGENDRAHAHAYPLRPRTQVGGEEDGVRTVAHPFGAKMMFGDPQRLKSGVVAHLRLRAQLIYDLLVGPPVLGIGKSGEKAVAHRFAR